MNEKKNIPAISAEERIAAIQRKRSAVMALATEEKAPAILNTDHPAALVHAFPEQDFLLLVEEIGPDDAMELIALASDRQWEHLVDARIWEDDRIDPVEATRWLHRLCRADFRRAIRWLTREKPEFLELFLFRNINIIVREPDVEPAAMPDGFFSFDQTFYMEIPELPPRTTGEARDSALRQELLHDLLSRLASDDHLMLQRILLEAVRILPAEAEEEEYRLRCVRMAEKGFLPFEEAIGIYQPLNPEDLARAADMPPVSHAETGTGPAAALSCPADSPGQRLCPCPGRPGHAGSAGRPANGVRRPVQPPHHGRPAERSRNRRPGPNGGKGMRISAPGPWRPVVRPGRRRPGGSSGPDSAPSPGADFSGRLRPVPEAPSGGPKNGGTKAGFFGPAWP